MRSIARVARTCSLALLAYAAVPAQALPPDQLFERVAPAVWSVRTYGASQQPLASASAVVIGAGKVVTSCRVLRRAHQVQLRRGGTVHEARLGLPDVERDLCQLEAPGLSASAPALGTARSLRIGQRLYVVGFSRDDEQSLGEGLVSSIAGAGTNKERIRTTVPSSVGLLGAGLFDDEGRLVGIVTGSPKDAASIAFAVPADWLAELPARGQIALAAYAKRRTSGTGLAAAGFPAPGTVWTYKLTDRMFSRREYDLTIRVAGVEGSRVEEVVSGTSGSAETRRAINASDARFAVYALSSSIAAVEPTPYLLVASAGKPPAELKSPEGYPLGSPGSPSWTTTVPTIEGWDRVAVPAGTYRALRIDVTGRRSAELAARTAEAKRFSMSAWYAPDVGRIVRVEHRAWSREGYADRLISHEILELLSYRPPS